jgi:ketosteroid isomerase-like protein
VPRENVEIVRKVYDAAARRDALTLLGFYDPEVEFDSSRVHGSLMGGAVYHGHEGLRRWARDWYEAWELIEYDVEELIDAGEHVIAVVTVRGRGRASAAEVEWTRHGGVWTFRDGKVVRVVWFPTREEALAAAGQSKSE